MKEEEKQSLEISNKEDYLIHYKKINIMGNEDVGKTSLIAFFENYHDKNFIIQPKNYSYERVESEVSEETDIHSLVEDVKRITVEYNGLTNLYLNIYETNLNELENIKNHLDTLLFQTECIIFIFDKNNIDSLQNIQKLIPIIIQKKINKEIRNIPIFLLKNKVDLTDEDEEQTQKIENEIKNIKNIYKDLIVFIELSLNIRDKFEEFIYDFYHYCYYDSKIDPEDFVNSIKLNDPIRQMKNNNIQNSPTIKISLIGESSVGKTSFLYYFYSKKIDMISSTIGHDIYRISAEVNKKKIFIELLDTAGQERYKSITKNQIQNRNCFIIFLDVTYEKSLEMVDNWIKIIKKVTNINNTLIYLVANKIDLIEERKVSRKDIENYSQKNGIIYQECSCKNGIGVYEIMNDVIYRGYCKTYNSILSDNITQSTKKLKKNLHKRKNHCC